MLAVSPKLLQELALPAIPFYEWMNTAHFQALYELKKTERRLMLEGMILEAAEG